MFLVAHPTKPSERKLGAQSTPSGFDISGSANFLNMSDVIMTVHRKQDEFGNKSQTVRVMVSKVRDTDFGHEGSTYFSYNPITGRYIPCQQMDFENEALGGRQPNQKGVSDNVLEF
jgi:twinkle protein